MPELAHSPLDAVFVGYENQENLGLRSIIALLQSHGFRAALVPFTPGNPEAVLSKIQATSPALVGFSIIFQYTAEEFAELTAALREAGVEAHFTVGGHFPSLRPQATLDLMPCVDSVVQFEGEHTTLELLRQVSTPAAWGGIPGLVFRQGDQIVINPPRPLIADLDTLPNPMRDRPRLLPRGVRVASMLASRGCLYDCSFCSIRQFYGSAPGPLRRARSPQHVVAEMQTLFEQDGVRFFIFQDDDFAAKTGPQRAWLHDFLQELDRTGLASQVRWKISCRVDDVDEDLMSRCRDHGLIAVYLGVESGSDAGLKTLNKHVTVAHNRAAIDTLKRLDLAFDMGFMLFDPDSTVETIRANIDFLSEVTADGACPANFCKMLPYAGTPIEQRLAADGRLKGTLSQPDYDFLDPRLDLFALFAARAFHFRNFDQLGLVERLRLAHFDQVLAMEFGPEDAVEGYKAALRVLTAQVNKESLHNLKAGLDYAADHDFQTLARDWSLLGYIADREWQSEIEFQYQLDEIIAAYNPDLLRAFSEEFAGRIAA